MISICEKYLQYEQPEMAMRYLNQAWEDRFERDRLELLDKVFVKTGDRKQLQLIRSRLFQSEQSYASFTRYLEALDEDEREKACSAAIKQAEQGGNIVLSADLLLNLSQTERAQALVLARHQELAECFYDSLLRLAKAFEKADCSLAATACYRALLLDILAQARSKAYGHGARYYKKLEALAKRIKEFKPLPTHHAFVQQLHLAHGRKKSFWARLES
jgi:DNA repair ATPase RecN